MIRKCTLKQDFFTTFKTHQDNTKVALWPWFGWHPHSTRLYIQSPWIVVQRTIWVGEWRHRCMTDTGPAPGDLEGTWDTWQLVGHQATKQAPPWWTQMPLGLLCHICSWSWWHFVQCFIFDTFSSNSQSDFHKRGNARFSHLCCYMVCKLCQFWNNIYMCSTNHVLFLIPTSFKIVASIVVRTTNCQWERAWLI